MRCTANGTCWWLEKGSGRRKTEPAEKVRRAKQLSTASEALATFWALPCVCSHVQSRKVVWFGAFEVDQTNQSRGFVRRPGQARGRITAIKVVGGHSRVRRWAGRLTDALVGADVQVTQGGQGYEAEAGCKCPGTRSWIYSHTGSCHCTQASFGLCDNVNASISRRIASQPTAWLFRSTSSYQDDPKVIDGFRACNCRNVARCNQERLWLVGPPPDDPQSPSKQSPWAAEEKEKREEGPRQKHSKNGATAEVTSTASTGRYEAGP
jgi:hypothetical protein